MTEEFQIFIKWSEFLKWLLNTTEKFPKKVRFTFTTRIDNLALDILEDIIEFRYDKNAKCMAERERIRVKRHGNLFEQIISF